MYHVHNGYYTLKCGGNGCWQCAEHKKATELQKLVESEEHYTHFDAISNDKIVTPMLHFVCDLAPDVFNRSWIKQVPEVNGICGENYYVKRKFRAICKSIQKKKFHDFGASFTDIILGIREQCGLKNPILSALKAQNNELCHIRWCFFDIRFLLAKSKINLTKAIDDAALEFHNAGASAHCLDVIAGLKHDICSRAQTRSNKAKADKQLDILNALKTRIVAATTPRRLGLVMALHKRLGNESGLHALSDELVHMIARYAEPTRMVLWCDLVK